MSLLRAGAGSLLLAGMLTLGGCTRSTESATQRHNDANTPAGKVGKAAHTVAVHAEKAAKVAGRELAKAEITADAKRFARALPLAVAGAILGLFALGLLLTTILLAIAIALPAWLSALIVFVGTAIIAWALFAAGKARLRRINVVPEKTVNTIKENAEWVKAQAR